MILISKRVIYSIGYILLLKLIFSCAEIQKVEICSDGEFFDAASLSCSSCSDISDNLEPDSSTRDANGNPTSCKCPQGYQAVEPTCLLSVSFF